VERNRPLVRVVFDGRLRTPARARLFATLRAVVWLVTSSGLAADPARRALQAAGAELVVLPAPNLRARLQCSARGQYAGS